MAQLLDNPGKFLNASNIVGRLTFGLLGLELKSKKDPVADEYLSTCITIFDDLDFRKDGSQLMTIFDYERPQRLGEISKEFQSLEPLIRRAYGEDNVENIDQASSLIQKLLSDLYDIIGSRELKE